MSSECRVGDVNEAARVRRSRKHADGSCEAHKQCFIRRLTYQRRGAGEQCCCHGNTLVTGSIQHDRSVAIKQDAARVRKSSRSNVKVTRADAQGVMGDGGSAA